MSTWTTPALQTLESYLRLNRLRVAASGADPDEVTADLRRHVEEEIAALQLPVVTENDVRRIVSQIGPVPEEEVPMPTDPPPARRLSPRLLDGLSSGVLVLFGVILPLTAIGVELFTGLCAGLLFDPLATVFHVALAAAVPTANLFAWRCARSPGGAVPRWLWLANGVACGVSLFYAVLFLPLSFFAVVAIVYFGLGFLPLCPLLAFCCAMRLRTLLKRQQLVRDETVWPGWGWSVAAPVLILVLVALPGPLTRHWITQAGSDSPDLSRRAVERLRSWGNEAVILKECYGRSSRLWIELFTGRDGRPNPDLARKVYFRVTGRSFNSVPPPLSKFQATGRVLFDEFEWDDGLGGDSVAGQIKGLSLVQSRFDGVCRPDEGWAYLEWTLEFQNAHERLQREARTQVLLPPDGVVTRLTLWINGEEREAAFAGRSQVREAYEQVAIQQRRDPVLVTTTGPDRVLVQCFPIQPGGGTMKVRLGVTVPLVVEGPDRVALKLPCVVERNFAVPESLRHSLWLEAPLPVGFGLEGLTANSATPTRRGMHGEISDAVLGSTSATLRFACTPALRSAIAKDTRSTGSTLIRQTLEEVPPMLPERIGVVLDGSEDMTEFFPQIARALEGIPAKPELAVWFARDGVSRIFDSTKPSRELVSAQVGSLRGIGGQDDLPALLQAWEWAAAKPDSVVLWIHGPQPVSLTGTESLKQRLEWRGIREGPRMIDVPTRLGPNRIVEQLGGLDAFASLPRLGELDADLDRLFANWTGRQAEYRLLRSAQNEEANSSSAHAASSHLVRLWASERVRELTRSRKFSEAVQLAVRFQLVTPLTGAVVLESAQQYAAAGLTPVDSATVPVVPEPSTWALLVLGILLCATFLRRPT